MIAWFGGGWQINDFSQSILVRRGKLNSVSEQESKSTPVSKREVNIGLVTIPFWGTIGNPGNIMFMELLAGACDELFVLTGEEHLRDILKSHNIHISYVKPVSTGQWWPIRAFKYLGVQLKICANMSKVSGHISAVIFFTGSTWFTIPVLWARVLRKRVALAVVSSEPDILRLTYDKAFFGKGGYVFYTIGKMLEAINCTMAHRIVLASGKLIEGFGLERYRKKVTVASTLYINERFKPDKSLAQRDSVVGYMGRLSAEKGSIELARAIPLVLSKRNKARFLIAGDGYLKSAMQDELRTAGCLDKVDFIGGVMREAVPEYLNRMKFHVIASHTEAFPAANLEAMACGAIAIATSVGGLPDMIEDGRTGFLLSGNSPQAIADKVIEVWEHPELEAIQKRAIAFVKDNFSYEKSVTKWKRILNELAGQDG